MKKLSLILAILMVLGALLSFVSCSGDTDKGDANDGGKDEVNTIAPADAVIKDMVAAIEKKVPFEDKVSEILYKEDDPDEMLCWTYGVIDIKGYELLADYVITMPSDYCNTLAIIKFKDGMTAEDFQAVKDAVATEYLKPRASALQMYMPEEYAKMQWANENPDKIWKQYGDNMLVLCVTGDSEPTDVWAAIDDYLAGK